MMIEKIASQLGRRDEAPNIALAGEIVEAGGMGLDEIRDGLFDDDSNVANDCIKVLYETGKIEPSLIAPYCDVFLQLLASPRNRLVWGAMTALSLIAESAAATIYRKIEVVKEAYRKGSVITVDAAIIVFSRLANSDPQYRKALFPLLMEHLQTCRPKEVAGHGERILLCIEKDNAEQFREVLESRYRHLSDAQKKRVDKIFRQIKN